MRNIFLFWGALLLVDGVFGDDDDVTVMEGDPVTLNPQTEIPEGEDDSAEWWFGDLIIAKMNKAAGLFSTSKGDDVGFNGRLKLDHQTGSLTITHTRTNDTGIYKLKIKRRNGTSNQTFSVTVRDVVKSLSVIEGDPVTLRTGVTKKQRDYQIQWKFGDQDLNGADASWSNTVLNDQTGDLNITNIRRNQFGDYEVEIKNKNSLILHKKFRITDVSASTPDPGLSSGAIAGIFVAQLLVFAAVLFAVVIYYKSTISQLQRRRNDAENN